MYDQISGSGVFREKERYDPFGLFVSSGTDKQLELMFLDENGFTRLKVIQLETLKEFAEKTLPQIAAYMPPDSGDAPPEIEPINLNGNHLMFEFERKPLIDEQMRSLQKQLNFLIPKQFIYTN